MMSKAVFLALFGVLFLQTFTHAEDKDAILSAGIKKLIAAADEYLPTAWKITHEREYSIGNATDLIPVFSKLADQIKEHKATPDMIKEFAVHLFALAEEVAKMEKDELAIMPSGHKLIKSAEDLAEKIDPDLLPK